MSAPRVLVVEDGDLLRSSLERVLRRHGYACEGCRTGREAIQAFERAAAEGAPFELVLSDVRMPDLDGLALLRFVKVRRPRTPVVLMTAFGDRAVMREALHLHGDEFIDKPFSTAELMRVIRETLRHVRLRDGLPGPESDPQATRREERLLGRYVLLGEIGRGASGVVYRARQVDLDRVVALKAYHPRNQDKARERLQREARAMAQLRHPNVAVVHEIARHGGVDYIAMEFVEGPTLRSLLAMGPLSSREAVGLGLSMARALEHCHARGILHRDLKPANIVLHASGRPVLVDFGIASPAGARGSDYVEGTLPYMPPEYAAGADYDPTCEVYGLGAVLYEVLAGPGVLPHWAGDLRLEDQSLQFVAKFAAADPVPLCAHARGVDEELAAIVDRAVARRGRRFTTMTELAEAFEGWVRRGDPAARATEELARELLGQD